MEESWNPNLMEEWIKQVHVGDTEAASALVDHLYPTIIRIVRGHLPWRMEETDLAQDIFLKIFSKIEQFRFRDGIPLEHWVSRIALNTCLDALRIAKRYPELLLSDFTEEETEWIQYLTSENTDVPQDTLAAREVVHKLLSQLKAEDRLVLTLLDLEEKSVREISQLTGWTQTGVKVRVFRARKRLRKIAEDFRKKNLI